MTNAPKLYTIGYEGVYFEEFVAFLGMYGLAHIVDVRAVPFSRRVGFNGSELSNNLPRYGFKYTHLPELGNTNTGRAYAKREDWDGMRREVEAQLETTEAKAALGWLGSIYTVAPTALMCYEQNPAKCHRTIVAEKLVGPDNVMSLPICTTFERKLQEKKRKEKLK